MDWCYYQCSNGPARFYIPPTTHTHNYFFPLEHWLLWMNKDRFFTFWVNYSINLFFIPYTVTFNVTTEKVLLQWFSIYYGFIKYLQIMGTNVCVHDQERVPDSPSPVPSLDDGRRSVSHLSSRQSSSVSSSPAHTESSSDRPRTSSPPHKSHVFF